MTTSSLIIPASGTSFEIGATAIFKGAKHPNAAKLWIEFALSSGLRQHRQGERELTSSW